MTNREGEGRGVGTDGGSERVEDTGETDHLRSVGRQHKPVGEGRSPLDSVLQRDEKETQKKRGDGVEMKTRQTKRGRIVVSTDTQRQLQRERKRARQKLAKL